MAIKITWSDFDKSIFITPKNIRKLMGFTITIGDDLGAVENKVNTVEQTANDAKKNADDAIRIGQTNQTGILDLNAQFRQLSQDIKQINGSITGMIIEIDDLKERVKRLEG